MHASGAARFKLATFCWWPLVYTLHNQVNSGAHCKSLYLLHAHTRVIFAKSLSALAMVMSWVGVAAILDARLSCLGRFVQRRELSPAPRCVRPCAIIIAHMFTASNPCLMEKVWQAGFFTGFIEKKTLKFFSFFFQIPLQTKLNYSMQNKYYGLIIKRNTI